MNGLPHWYFGQLAENLTSAGVAADMPRANCPYWVSASWITTATSERELMEVVARVGIAALLAGPLRPIGDAETHSRAAAQRNRGYAAGIVSSTLLVNGFELRPTAVVPAIARAETQIRQGFAPLEQVVRTLAEELARLAPGFALPFEFEADPEDSVLPAPPTTYLASALTGFRDVAAEWLWTRGVDAEGSARSDDGAFSDPRTDRATAGLNFQRETNDRVAELLRGVGIKVFVPHEQFDPDHHTDKTSTAVDLGDRLGVAGSDVIIFLGDYPATGAGKELVLAESGLQFSVLVASLDARTSRLISGTPHRTCELVEGVGEWPCAIVDAVLADLRLHQRHQAVRAANTASARHFLDLLPSQADDRENLLSYRRAEQLRMHPELFWSASMAELQGMASIYGHRLEVRLIPHAEETERSPSSAPQQVDEIANDWLDATDGVSRSSPNSAEAIRRAMGIKAPIVDASLSGDGLTHRGEDGQFLIYLPGRQPRRERFTLVHEIAHILIEGEKLTTSHRRGADPDRQLEDRADALAAALLLPDEWLIEARADLLSEGVAPGSVDELRALAKTVDVTPAVVALRLSSLNPEQPVVYLLLAQAEREWAVVNAAGLPPEWYEISGGHRGLRITGLPAPETLLHSYAGQVRVSLKGRKQMAAQVSIDRNGDSAAATLSNFVYLTGDDS